MDENLVNTLSTKKDEKSKARGGAPKGSQHALKHGLTILKRAVNSLGNRVIDKRTVTGKALAKWRQDLINDLGGDVSTQQATIVDLAVQSKLLTDSIGAWLLTQESLINKRRRSVIPAVKDWKELSEGLGKHIDRLGLERQQKPVDGWDAIREKYGKEDETEGNGERQHKD